MLGMPAAVLGLLMMLMGWRFQQVAVAGTYAVIGGVLAWSMTPVDEFRWLATVSIAAAGAYLAVKLYRFAVPVLGGLVGVCVMGGMLRALPIDPVFVMLATIVSFIALGATAFVLFRQVVIVITAFEGSLLLVSGLLMLAQEYPSWAGSFHQLVRQHTMLGPFTVIAMALTGIFTQLAATRQQEQPSEVW